MLQLGLRRTGGWSHIVSLGHQELGDLLAAVDALLFFNAEQGFNALYLPDFEEIEEILRYGRSAYRIADDRWGLTYRVDPTALESFRDTVARAEPTAAQQLSAAWRHAYKPDPDATAAYREAVRAVEQAEIPLVSPNHPRASLGTVITDLRNQTSKWELVLVDKYDQPGPIEPFVSLLERLWQGQRSRHGGSSTSRDQTDEEAQAAVHLAVLAVQWLASGALRKRP